MSHLKLLLLAITVLTVAGIVWAAESDELRERARAMQREAADLAEQGQRKEAEEVERNAIKMLEVAQRLERVRPDNQEGEIRELEQLLERLRRQARELEETGNRERLANVRQKAEQVERELRELHEPRQHRQHRPAGPDEEIARRLDHMRAAVEHLNHAGLPDMAKHVAERAEATQRELDRHRQHQEGKSMQEMLKQLEALRREVGKLRDDVNQLKAKR